MKKLSNKEFTKRAKKVHGSQYDYSKVNYFNAHTKIIIICKKHGEFKQSPRHHIRGQGCKKCSSIILTNEIFVKRANKVHNNKYNYSKVKYKNNYTKVIIICNRHGNFLQTPSDHFLGKGCRKCYFESRKLDIKDFVKIANKAHNNKYDYSQIEYKNNNTKIIIICPKHGEFRQRPRSHLCGDGCPKCIGRISKTGTKWLDKIEKESNIKLEREFPLTIGDRQFFVDGFCKNTNTCYEYYGNYWHGNPEIYKSSEVNPSNNITFGELYQKTLEKEELIKSAGYNLITKWGR